MNGYQSIATIRDPEFINLQPNDINPMMSKCEIKVFYLGKNRNSTAIDKPTAQAMAKTLRGAPIVGYYRPDKSDFFDHGDQVIYDGEGIHFQNLTKPYGFVAPDAEVWFQEFEEYDENGTSVLRTYLMTTGYLWTGQYQEAQQVLMDGGKPQSMELDEDSMMGFWSKEANDDHEFFIINDAIFSKLCILGDDVEPCFEGSSITAPNVSRTFSLDNKFKRTLYSMMKELQETLQGGKETVNIEEKQVETKSTVGQGETPIIEAAAAVPEVAVETPVAVEEPAQAVEEPAASAEAEEQPAEIQAENLDNSVEAVAAENEDSIEATSEFEKKEDEKEDEKKEDGEDKEDKKDDDKKKEEKDYALIQIEYDELQKSHADLQAKFNELSEEIERLRSFKAEVENKEKDALIAEFYMLSDADKEDVIAHKAQYSLDEIKSKLAILCFEKKVSFTSANDTKVDMTGMTVNAQYSEGTDVPEWLKAVDRYNENK